MVGWETKLEGVPAIGGTTYVEMAYDLAELLAYCTLHTYI